MSMQVGNPAQCAGDAPQSKITATLVSEDQRLNFLPFYFGTALMMQAENAVYDWMGRLCRDYHGGYWEFYELSNGGFYMAPRSAQPLRCFAQFNGWEGELSADAAGIVATAFAVNQLIWQGHGQQLNESYYKLMDYVLEHPEFKEMHAILD